MLRNATDGFFFVSREKLEPFDWSSSLRNRKIIGWRPGSTPQLFFEYVLQRKGVDAETIKNIITNVPPPAREGAVLQRYPSGIVTNSRFALQSGQPLSLCS
jgi:NitT/TauT family transport system substrate-binding protein